MELYFANIAIPQNDSLSNAHSQKINYFISSSKLDKKPNFNAYFLHY